MENGTLWDVIKRLIVSMIKTLTARREAYAAQAQREQAQMYQNQKTIQWNNAMKQIQQELFAVFSANTYPLLKQVSVINDILPAGYRPGGKYVLFDFRLTLTRSDVLAVLLSQIKEKMNYDLECFQQTVQNSFCQEQALILYPCTMAGLRIIEIRQNGIFLNISAVTRCVS